MKESIYIVIFFCIQFHIFCETVSYKHGEPEAGLLMETDIPKVLHIFLRDFVT